MKPDITDLSPIKDFRGDNLKYFYYIAAEGGIANDGDTFEARILYLNKEDFLRKMDRLGIVIKMVSEVDKNQELNAIKNLPDLIEPKFVTIDEVKVLIHVNNSITFYINGTGTNNPYSFTMADYNACLRLEKIFDECQFYNDIDYSIEDYAKCIYKKKNK